MGVTTVSCEEGDSSCFMGEGVTAVSCEEQGSSCFMGGGCIAAVSYGGYQLFCLASYINVFSPTLFIFRSQFKWMLTSSAGCSFVL